MGLNDLTPELRTRLNRMERLVGLFVGLAVLLLLSGLLFYLHHTAERKGWFLLKVKYMTGVEKAAGLKVGDPVKLMGFTVGEITRIEANDPWAYYNVTIEFVIREPYYGYLWSDSSARIVSADFLGNRSLEVVKGRNGLPTILETNRVAAHYWSRPKRIIAGMLNRQMLEEAMKAAAQQGLNETQPTLFPAEKRAKFYQEWKPAGSYWLEPKESPALADRLEVLADKAEAALPSFLSLTNQLNTVLSNTVNVTARAEALLSEAQPVILNVAAISRQLREKDGALGDWLIPPQLQRKLGDALAQANSTLANTDTNLTAVATHLNRSLDQLTQITSNLNAQVQANTNILKEISHTIVHADEVMQGLKRHWLLRSAFKAPATNKPPSRPLWPKRGVR